MKKALTLGAIVASMGVGACQQRGLKTETSWSRTTSSYSTDDIEGSKLRGMSNKDYGFSTESVAIWGERFWLGQSDSLDSLNKGYLIKDSDYHHRINHEGKEIRAEPNAVYIPRSLRNSEGELATRASLAIEGDDAIVAKFTEYEELSKTDSGIIRETQKDMRFNIDSMKMWDIEVSHPLVGSSSVAPEGSPNRLGFYTIPREKAELDINRANGQITFITEPGGIYVWERLPIEDFKAMEKATEEKMKAEKAVKEAEEEQSNIGRIVDIK